MTFKYIRSKHEKVKYKAIEQEFTGIKGKGKLAIDHIDTDHYRGPIPAAPGQNAEPAGI